MRPAVDRDPMTSALDTVLPIAAVGSGLLFLALAGLIGLMYLLTSSWFYGEAEAVDETEEPPEETIDETSAPQGVAALEEAKAADEAAEADRRRRAVAVAVTVAVAHARAGRTARRATAGGSDPASEWRRAGRARRLSKPRRRARTSP